MSETPTPDLTERAREEAPSPTVDQMRYAWCWYGNPTRQESDRRAEEFDAWLAAHDEQVRREAKAEADDLADEIEAQADIASRPGQHAALCDIARRVRVLARDGGAR